MKYNQKEQCARPYFFRRTHQPVKSGSKDFCSQKCQHYLLKTISYRLRNIITIYRKSCKHIVNSISRSAGDKVLCGTLGEVPLVRDRDSIGTWQRFHWYVIEIPLERCSRTSGISSMYRWNIVLLSVEYYICTNVKRWE